MARFSPEENLNVPGTIREIFVYTALAFIPLGRVKIERCLLVGILHHCRVKVCTTSLIEKICIVSGWADGDWLGRAVESVAEIVRELLDLVFTEAYVIEENDVSRRLGRALEGGVCL